jgi:hypothetical protein
MPTNPLVHIALAIIAYTLLAIAKAIYKASAMTR